jgi:ABC-2 type transport system permease protein
MTSQSNVLSDFPIASTATAPAKISEVQRFYWSVRCELWENRSIYIAPLAIAALIVVGFLYGMIRLRFTDLGDIDPEKLHAVLQQPYGLAAILLMGVALLVSVFYCLDALYGERRDRSILFWKSLPVSDTTAVLAKMAIPVVVLPAVTFVITIVTQALMLLIATLALSRTPLSPTVPGNHVALLSMSGMLLFHLIAIHGFWYAPIYAWLLLVSAWARRAPLLWATIPPLAVVLFEQIALHTRYVAEMLKYRFGGGPAGERFQSAATSMSGMNHGDLVTFLAGPGLWTGLALAAILLAAAIRIRRSQGPL